MKTNRREAHGLGYAGRAGPYRPAPRPVSEGRAWLTLRAVTQMTPLPDRIPIRGGRVVFRH